MSMKSVMKTAQGVLKNAPHPSLLWQHRYPVGAAAGGMVGLWWLNRRRRSWKRAHAEALSKVNEAVAEVQKLQAVAADKAKELKEAGAKTKKVEDLKGKIEEALHKAEAKVAALTEELKQAKTLRAAEKKEWERVAADAAEREAALRSQLHAAQAAAAAQPKEA